MSNDDFWGDNVDVAGHEKVRGIHSRFGRLQPRWFYLKVLLCWFLITGPVVGAEESTKGITWSPSPSFAQYHSALSFLLQKSKETTAALCMVVIFMVSGVYALLRSRQGTAKKGTARPVTGIPLLHFDPSAPPPSEMGTESEHPNDNDMFEMRFTADNIAEKFKDSESFMTANATSVLEKGSFVSRVVRGHSNQYAKLAETINGRFERISELIKTKQTHAVNSSYLGLNALLSGQQQVTIVDCLDVDLGTLPNYVVGALGRLGSLLSGSELNSEQVIDSLRKWGSCIESAAEHSSCFLVVIKEYESVESRVVEQIRECWNQCKRIKLLQAAFFGHRRPLLAKSLAAEKVLGMSCKSSGCRCKQLNERLRDLCDLGTLTQLCYLHTFGPISSEEVAKAGIRDVTSSQRYMAALSAETQVIRSNIKTMIAKDIAEVVGNLMDKFSSSSCFFDDTASIASSVAPISTISVVPLFPPMSSLSPSMNGIYPDLSSEFEAYGIQSPFDFSPVQSLDDFSNLFGAAAAHEAALQAAALEDPKQIKKYENAECCVKNCDDKHEIQPIGLSSLWACKNHWQQYVSNLEGTVKEDCDADDFERLTRNFNNKQASQVKSRIGEEDDAKCHMGGCTSSAPLARLGQTGLYLCKMHYNIYVSWHDHCSEKKTTKQRFIQITGDFDKEQAREVEDIIQNELDI